MSETAYVIYVGLIYVVGFAWGFVTARRYDRRRATKLMKENIEYLIGYTRWKTIWNEWKQDEEIGKLVKENSWNPEFTLPGCINQHFRSLKKSHISERGKTLLRTFFEHVLFVNYCECNEEKIGLCDHCEAKKLLEDYFM
jgi:hypothetical protein